MGFGSSLNRVDRNPRCLSNLFQHYAIFVLFVFRMNVEHFLPSDYLVPPVLVWKESTNIRRRVLFKFSGFLHGKVYRAGQYIF